MKRIRLPELPKSRARQRRKESHEVGKATVDLEWGYAPASVWNVGDSIFGYETRRLLTSVRHVYTAVSLVKRDGAWRLMACIESPTWKGVQEAFGALGFEHPTLTAKEVRRAA